MLAGDGLRLRQPDGDLRDGARRMAQFAQAAGQRGEAEHEEDWPERRQRQKGRLGPEQQIAKRFRAELRPDVLPRVEGADSEPGERSENGEIEGRAAWRTDVQRLDDRADRLAVVVGRGRKRRLRVRFAGRRRANARPQEGRRFRRRLGGLEHRRDDGGLRFAQAAEARPTNCRPRPERERRPPSGSGRSRSPTSRRIPGRSPNWVSPWVRLFKIGVDRMFERSTNAPTVSARGMAFRPAETHELTTSQSTDHRDVKDTTPAGDPSNVVNGSFTKLSQGVQGLRARLQGNAGSNGERLFSIVPRRIASASDRRKRPRRSWSRRTAIGLCSSRSPVSRRPRAST